MQLLSCLMGLGLMVAPCFGEMLWSGGGEEARLVLVSGTSAAFGSSFGAKEAVHFSVDRGSSSLHRGGGVGEITGFLREGLAFDARKGEREVDRCKIRFQEDGKVELIFVWENPESKVRKEYRVLLTRAEARELVRVV